MAELCPKHQLTLAPDGQCVLCRRTSASLGFDEPEEGWGGRLVTVVLGAGLVGAAASMLLAGRDAGHATASPAPRPAAAQTATGEPNSAQTPGPTSPRVDRSTTGQPTGSRYQPTWEEIGVAEETFVQARGDVELVMYAAPWCYICDGARTFLQARGVTLVERDIELDPAAMRALGRVNPSRSVPTFELQGETIVGFNAWDLADRIDEAVARRIVASR